jgi:putative spermidine/putrescine transport system permease protein
MKRAFNSASGRALIFLSPGLLYLAIFFAAPLITSLLASFGFDGSGQGFTARYYAKMWSTNTMLYGLRTSIYYGIAPTLTTLVISIGLALLLRRHFYGRALFNGLYKIPMAVPGIIVALMVLTLAERGGFFDRLAAPMGITLPKMVRDEWGIGVIAATTWKQIPFMTLVITGAFAAIPEELAHASRSLGASRMRTFIFIELPLALPGITAAVLLTFIGSMGSYAIPDLIGPPSPRPLSVLMLSEFGQGNFNQVYAIGMVLSLFAIAVLLLYYWLTSGLGMGGQRGD